MSLPKQLINDAASGNVNQLDQDLTEYLKRDGNINDTETSGNYANLLYYGLQNKDINILTYLLKNGANPSSLGNPSLGSPLFEAIRHQKSLGKATLIIKSGGKPLNVTDEQNVIVSLFNLYDDSPEIKTFFDLLLENNTISYGTFLDAIIKFGANEGNSNLLNYLKDLIENQKIDINYRFYPANNTLLHLAAQYGNCDLTDYLRQKQANDMALNGNAEKPIDRAFFGRSLNITNNQETERETIETINQRLKIIATFFSSCGKKIEKLGWFDEWKKENKKAMLAIISKLRPLLAEPVEQYILTNTCDKNIELILQKQIEVLTSIADTLKSQQLDSLNKKDASTASSTFFNSMSKSV